MSTTVPMGLLRLRSATTAYLAVLRDSLPDLDVLVKAEPPDIPRSELGWLCDSVRTATEHRTHYGTPVHIAGLLSVLLGEGETRP